jgi:hypothetical protein
LLAYARAPTALQCLQRKTWMAGAQASEATPFFERLCPAMTFSAMTFSAMTFSTMTFCE